jgi:hypothetical protein
LDAEALLDFLLAVIAFRWVVALSFSYVHSMPCALWVEVQMHPASWIVARLGFVTITNEVSRRMKHGAESGALQTAGTNVLRKTAVN